RWNSFADFPKSRFFITERRTHVPELGEKALCLPRLGGSIPIRIGGDRGDAEAGSDGPETDRPVLREAPHIGSHPQLSDPGTGGPAPASRDQERGAAGQKFARP